MSIKFNELNKDGPVKSKEQILEEMLRFLVITDEEFEDVPF